AVLAPDRSDDLFLANEGAGKLRGFGMDDATRRAIDGIIADPVLVSLIREMRQSRSLNGRRIVEHTFGAGESARACKITLSCVGDQSGEISGVVTVIHDMTREKEISRMKNDFVSHVSHELRTPLASIKAYVEMLVDGEAQDEKTRRDFYEVIQNEANRLSRLIDNILNISRIESGLVKINKQPTSLMVILKQAIEVVTPQARGKGIMIDEQLEPAFYQTFGDRDMLYQAVMNLLGNAIKYTPENGRITVQTVANESANSVTVRIADTGVGIPEKALPFLFDKFYRVEENNHMGKGTGLGLSLVKHIVETVHRGQVFVESTVGKGSTFGFTLELTR
ncbi:MAG TPA: ATP-binding protein, partial [Tepidisphaeraceae bacterium]|nr:ATP-binding protein [Tepidisphaeraceae bacterium]